MSATIFLYFCIQPIAQDRVELGSRWLELGTDLLVISNNPSLEVSIGAWAVRNGINLQIVRHADGKLALTRQEPIVWCAPFGSTSLPGNVRSLCRAHPALACVPHDATSLAREALDAGFRDYLGIPTSEYVLNERLDRLIKPQAPRSLNPYNVTSADVTAVGMTLGTSTREQSLLDAIETVAPFPTTVLFMGETGAGKEEAARLLHQVSPRSHAPFITLHLAALPRDLIESEIFGHVKGAFTGATQDRKGALEAAEGGTLFLDEIGDIALDIQVKLLRVIQTREYTPIGTSQPLHSNCRILAATNRDLIADVRAGRFRADLYYRLSVYPIEVPPLRERMDGLEALVNVLLQRLNQELGTSIKACSPEALLKLRAYPWPGNVRELRNVLERACIAAKTGVIEASHLNIQPAPEPVAQGKATELVIRDSDLGGDFRIDYALEAMETTIIRRALQISGGNLSEAARLLGLPRSTLYNRLIKRSINPDDDSSVN